MISEKQLKRKEKKWENEKKLIERENKIKEEKNLLQKNRKKITTTKLLIAFLFINCTIIELFTGWVTIQNIQLAKTLSMIPDYGPLIGLIGAVVGEVMGFAVYSLKSSKENSQGGIIYDLAMQQNEISG